MKTCQIIRVFALSLFLGSCQDAESEAAQKPGKDGRKVPVEPSARGQAGTRQRTAPKPRSKVDGINERFTRLNSIRDADGKRELFADILMELPPDEHDLAVAAVVDDLKASDPANLVAEYLEMSSFLSPALQLPGIVRLLEEPALPQILRIVMEQQLREELGLGPEEEVTDWRPRVEEHLKKLPGVLVE